MYSFLNSDNRHRVSPATQKVFFTRVNDAMDAELVQRSETINERLQQLGDSL